MSQCEWILYESDDRLFIHVKASRILYQTVTDSFIYSFAAPV